MLDQDEHNVVAVQALSGPVQDVLLDSTVPMLDMVRAVVDLYAEVEHLDVCRRPAATVAVSTSVGLPDWGWRFGSWR
jgi:hypothetical protein